MSEKDPLAPAASAEQDISKAYDDVQAMAPSSTSADSHDPRIKVLEDELSKAKEDVQAHWERLLRKEAELQNIHRRHQDELKKAKDFAMERFARELLGVMDGFEHALKAMDKDADESLQPMREGVELTFKLLSDTMAKFGIQRIETEQKLFDPHLHEAMSMQAVEGVPEHQILMEIQSGYVLHDRVLRAARVVVSAPKSAS